MPARWNDNHLSLPQVLPLMGTGFWQKWVADVKQTYNPYLTGYNSDVNAAAQKVVDYLVVQSYYGALFTPHAHAHAVRALTAVHLIMAGNDYTTQGTRYVAAIQQYQIDLTQQQALGATDAAINAAIDNADEVIADNLIQQTALTIRISALALQMYVVVKQLCASYQYQMTQLYTQCVDATTANPLSMMCGAGAAWKPLPWCPLLPETFVPSSHTHNVTRPHTRVGRFAGEPRKCCPRQRTRTLKASRAYTTTPWCVAVRKAYGHRSCSHAHHS